MKIRISKNARNALQVIAGSGVFALLVFATATVRAPDVLGGLILTAFAYGLTVLALIGIGVREWKEITKHLAIATPVALAIALLGGHFWAGEPWQQLIGWGFFTSVAHIAFLVGVLSGSIADAKTK